VTFFVMITLNLTPTPLSYKERGSNQGFGHIISPSNSYKYLIFYKIH
jgi:hypothetical protein